VREAAANEAQARAQFFPTVNAGATGAHARTLSPFGVPTVGTNAEPLAQMTWQVDLFGRLADLRGAARARYLASVAAHDAAALSVAAATASGYITLRALDARLQVTRETLAARTEALRLARSRAEAGYTSRLELMQATAEYEATAQIVPQLERAIATQENGLSVLQGTNPYAVERGLALSALPVPVVPAGLPSDLLRRRPDIAQAENALAASDLTLSAQRKAYLPNLQLTGSAGRLFATGLANPVNLFSIGGSILAPIFDAGRARAGADAAAAQRDQAAFAYRGVALAAFQEVDSALVALDRLNAESAHVQAQRNALADALRHARNRYRAGYSDYLTELDAQRGLLSADLALVQNRSDRLTASVTLYRALGGGWDAGNYGTEVGPP
jgi:NodT family efflux transporter outer membrane factor (OMF) lipoprotein